MKPFPANVDEHYFMECIKSIGLFQLFLFFALINWSDELEGLYIFLPIPVAPPHANQCHKINSGSPASRFARSASNTLCCLNLDA